MLNVRWFPLQRLQGDMIRAANKLVKEKGDLPLASLMKKYGEDGTEEFPTILVNEFDEVMGLEGKGWDESILLLRVMLAVDKGMVRVKMPSRHAPRRKLQ